MNEAFISRARLRPRGVVNQHRLASGAYGYHQLIWQLFPGASGTAPFVYRMASPREPVFVVSSTRPEPGRIWDVETKPYTPQLRVGEKLAFSLRASATVCRDHRRHDLVVDRRCQGDSRPYLVIADEVFPPWLARQGERFGFQLDCASVSNWERVKTTQQRSRRAVQFTYMDAEGVLTVTDPDALTTALVHGIGRARSFGCGLMLVRRLS